MSARGAVRLAFVLLAIAGAVFIARPYAQGLSLVVRAADLQGTVRRVADFGAASVTRRDVEIPFTTRALRARVYEPAGASKRTALLVSGLHPSGIDEVRFTGLAEDLAASGVTVVTPDIPDLREFAITAATTDAIEAAGLWLASQPSFAPDGRIGMIGVSFSGGLSIVAAGRPALQNKVAYVFSYGGHGDLPRVLKYVCTGVEEPPPDSESPLGKLRLTAEPPSEGGTRPPLPHDYGAALLLLNLADRVVPPAQVVPLRAAVRRFLLASALDRVDKVKAQEEFARLRALGKTLPQPSATLLGYVSDRDVVHLGARLLPHINAFGSDPALSPARAPTKPTAPVFLVHGLEDNVIPAAESVHLSNFLRGSTAVRLLLTGLVTHGDVNRPVRFSEVMALASFVGDLLNR